MMRIRTQRGMGFVTLFILLSIGGVAAVAAMKIVPLYLDDASVASAFKSLEKQGAGGASRQEVKTFLSKRLEVNQLDGKIPLDNLVIESATGGGKRVVLDYEARANVMGNLDAVAKFSHAVTVR